MRFERSYSLRRISLLLGKDAESYYSAHALTLWHSAHALTSAAFVWTLTMGFSTCTPHQTGRGGGEHAAPRGNRARTIHDAYWKWAEGGFVGFLHACVRVRSRVRV